jgi:hypothetical protein
LSAYAFLASKRRAREHHEQLSLLLLSQSTDGKVIDKQFADWEKDF